MLKLWLGVGLVSTTALMSCVEVQDHEEDCTQLASFEEETITLRQGMSVSQVSGCSLAAVRGLDTQIIDEMNCLVEGVLVDFSELDISLGGTSPWPLLQAPAKDALARAIRSRGITFSANSIYRPITQQYLLYQWYQRGQCGIGLAAAPGRSNHQSGLAVDISDYNGWKSYLEAEGWDWYGSGDRVHFTYRGGGTQDIRDTAVLAFQRLWNRNNPGDLIGEDGSYGPQTETKLRASPLEGFARGADCGGVDPDPPDDAEMSVSLGIDTIPGQVRDLNPDGSSAGIYDLLEDQEVRLTFTVRNGAGRPATDDVIIGYEVEDPWLGLKSYTIESDFPALDGESWRPNDALNHPGNPGVGVAPSAGILHLNPMGPGESKRVSFTIQGAGYDEGGGKPHVRLWVQHVADYYGEMTGWDDAVEVNHAPDLLRRGAILDVLSLDHWEWGGDEMEDLEGWSSCGDAALRVESGELFLFGGRDSCLESPAWTDIDADTYKALALRMRHTHEEVGSKLFWRCPDTGDYGPECSVSFVVPGDGQPHLVEVDLSGVASWRGHVEGLRVLPVGEPVDLEVVALDAIYPLVEVGDPGPDPNNSGQPGNNGDQPGNNGGRPGNNSSQPGNNGGQPGNNGDVEPNNGRDGKNPDDSVPPTDMSIKSSGGCSSVPGQMPGSGGFWWVLGLGLLWRFRGGGAAEPDA